MYYTDMGIRKNHLSKHVSTVHEEKKRKKAQKIHFCTICEGPFETKRKLIQHIDAVHEKKKPFKCNLCDTTFALRHHLENHILAIHEIKKPFQCPKCDVQFLKKCFIKIHVTMVHEGTESDYLAFFELGMIQFKFYVNDTTLHLSHC